MAKPIRISGETDFGTLLKRLSDDIVFAPAFLRIDKQFGELFEKYRDEINQAEFFWAMVATAVRETGLSRLARVYDQEGKALSLRTLLLTIEANKHLFDDNAVKKRVNPSFAQSIVAGSHFPDSKQLGHDLTLVSSDDPLVNKIVVWRNNFGAHVSPNQTIKKTLADATLPTQDEAFALCNRAFDVFNRYTSLFHAVSHSRVIIGEEGSVESVFNYLRFGLAARRRDVGQGTVEGHEGQ
jgi:AbiU2